MLPTRWTHSSARALAIAVATLISLPSLAQQDAASAVAPGRITFTSDVMNREIAAKDQPAMIAKIKAVGQTIVATSALTNPKGMAIDWSVRLAAPLDGMPKTDPFPARGQVLLRKIDLKRNGKPDGDGRYGGEGEGPSIKLTANDPFGFYSGNVDPTKAATATFNLPVGTKWDGGSMTVKQSGETVLVVGRADRAPFVLLTREQALNALLEELLGDGIPPESKGIANIKAELAALSPTDRTQPACRGGKEAPNRWLTECAANAMYQVRRNSDYFDTAKARTSIQLVTFRVGDAGAVGEDKDEGDRLRQAFAQIDLAAVRKLLD